MLIKELLAILSELDPEGEVSIVDNGISYRISDVVTCEDKSSEYYMGYADIVVDFNEINE